MNIHKSDIEWCSHTWNPVTGCKHGCEYCYARRIVSRFGPHPCERPIIEPLEVLPKGTGSYYVERPTKLCDENGEPVRSTPYPKGFAPTYHAYTMDYPEKRKTPARIFVSSMGDLFGKWVPDIWIEDVFAACKRAPQHTYLFLTKNPQRYCDLANAGKLPTEPNFWYGTTVTHKGAPFFGEAIRYNTFLSIEPLMEDLEAGVGSFGGVRWVIVGAMTGTGSKAHQPKREWVENIVETARLTGAAVFMKDSMAPIWGPDLIREYPEGMVQVDGDASVEGNAWVGGNALVKGTRDIYWISCIGSRDGTTTFFRNANNDISVSCGCFYGTIDEFAAAVTKTHGDNEHAQAYRHAIEIAKLRIKLTDAES